MKKFRSLFVIPRYWPAIGGAQLHTRELTHRLAEYHQVGVVHHCSDEDEQLEMAAAISQPKIEQDGAVPLHQLTPAAFMQKPLQKLAGHIPRHRSARKLYNTLFQKSIQAQLDSTAVGYDLIHSVYNGLTASTQAALNTARKQGKPFVWTPLAHTDEPSGTAWSSDSFRKLYREADALIAMTPYEREFLIEMGAQAQNVHVCPVSVLLDNNANPASYRQRHQLGNDPVVLFLGRHVEDKGYRQLAHAAERIWQSNPQTRFVFMGPGSEQADHFFDTIQDPRILRQPQVSEAEKSSALAACNLLCVPSTRESLGVIYLEAWHYAKPVVAADIPVLHSVIQNEQDGLLCDQEPGSIANAISRLINDPHKSQEMGLAGQHKLNTLYDWGLITSNLCELYAAVMFSHHLHMQKTCVA